MLNSEPFLRVDFGRERRLRGIERLRVEAAPEASSEADAALARLVAAGLCCRSVPGPRLHILGGKSAFEERGVRGYRSPFAILGEPGGGFLAMVAGTQGARDEEVREATLASAVDAVLRFYRGRSE